MATLQELDAKIKGELGSSNNVSGFSEDEQAAWLKQRRQASPQPVTPTVEPTQTPTALRRGGDLLASASQAVLGIPQALIGLANIPTMGYAGKAIDAGMEKVGLPTFKKLSDFYEKQKSAEQQVADKKVAEAKGFVGTAKAMVENPSTIVHGILQSAPSMVAGGLIGKAAKYLPGLSKISPLARGAAGEGAISAGFTAEGARQRSEDGLITPKQAVVSTGSGILTAGLGVFGGKVAQKLGIADVDTLLAGGNLSATQKRNVLVAGIKGALAESVFEELPQSMQEQIANNLNNNRPWDEGVAEAGAQGMMTALPMGGGVGSIAQMRANRMSGVPQPPENQPVQQPAPVPQPIAQTPPPVVEQPPVIEEPPVVEQPPIIEAPIVPELPIEPPVAPTPRETTLGTSMVSPEEIQTRAQMATIIGQQAFAMGKEASPMKDPQLMKLLEGVGPGEGLPILEAWHNAWHKANANAPVPGIPERPTAKPKPIKVEKPVVSTTKPTFTVKPLVTKNRIPVSKEDQKKYAKWDMYPGEPIVTKTQVKDMMEAMGGDVIFTITEKDSNKYFSHSNEDGTKTIDIKPSALGLIEDNLKAGDTVELKKADFKAAGSSYRAYDENGDIVASKQTTTSPQPNVAKTTEDLKERINQLNKLAQSWSVLRRSGSKKGTAGMFTRGPSVPQKKGRVHIANETTMSPDQYMSTLGHELGHALDFLINGNTGKNVYKLFGDDLTQEQKAVIKKELMDVTDNLVGSVFAKMDPTYYYSNAELFARFLETMVKNNQKLAELAPNAWKNFQLMSIKHPKIAEYIEAALGEIDKGQFKYILFRDMRQTYHKYLGKRVGDIAYNMELRYRNMKERAKSGIMEAVKNKFKDVKDDPELIYDVIEATLSTTEGVPKFGTRDIQYAEKDSEIVDLINAGYEQIPSYKLKNGEQYPMFAKQRWTEEQGQIMYNQLSPEGKKLVKDFTAKKEERTDAFNREFLRELYKIDAEVEGWVHRIYEDDSTPIGVGDRLKFKTASSRKKRSMDSGTKGVLIKDVQISMIKGITELQIEKDFNEFVEDYFASISKIIPEGDSVEKGYTEVYGKVEKGGVGSYSEVTKTRIVGADGKSFMAPLIRYQVPTDIYRRFELIQEVAEDISNGVRLINTLNRYWRINILAHPGTVSTNAISGALQFSAKFFTDFYMDILTLDPSLTQTRKNTAAVLTTIPGTRGWKATPDWTYGGDSSQFFAEFQSGKTPGVSIANKKIDKAVDVYGDKALKLFSTVERYWKKVIAKAEGADKLGHLGVFGKNGFDLPTEVEKQMLDIINSEVDMWALDYENVPTALEDWNKSAFTSAIKPFMKYPYKIFKTFSAMVTKSFDQTLPYEERVAAILTVGTMLYLINLAMKSREDEEETPEVGENSPSTVSKKGRLYVGKDGKDEMFIKVTKYPFLNVRELVSNLKRKDIEGAGDVLKEMLGTVGPVGEISAVLLGYKNEYNTYVPGSVITGKALSSFVPLSRILNDVSRVQDPYKRRQETFAQPFTSLIPLPGASDELLEKYRGKARTMDVPLEGSVKRLPGDAKGRTTTTKYIRENPNDIWWSLFTGLNLKRINPEEAKAFAIREKENAEKSIKKAAKNKKEVIH